MIRMSCTWNPRLDNEDTLSLRALRTSSDDNLHPRLHHSLARRCHLQPWRIELAEHLKLPPGFTAHEVYAGHRNVTEFRL